MLIRVAAAAAALTFLAGADAHAALDGAFTSDKIRAEKASATLTLDVSGGGRQVTPTITYRTRACGKAKAGSQFTETRQLAAVAVNASDAFARTYTYTARTTDAKKRKVTAKVTVKLSGAFEDDTFASGRLQITAKVTGKGRKAMTCKLTSSRWQAQLTAPADDSVDDLDEEDLLDEELTEEDLDELIEEDLDEFDEGAGR